MTREVHSAAVRELEAATARRHCELTALAEPVVLPGRTPGERDKSSW